MVFGGGRPYLVGGGNLYSVDDLPDSGGNLPAFKTARVSWEGLDTGNLWEDKTFHGMAVGLDCSGSVTLEDRSRISSAAPLTVGQIQIRPAGIQAPAWRFKGYKSAQITLELRVTPDTQTLRCILRPPLTVKMDDLREVTV